MDASGDSSPDTDLVGRLPGLTDVTFVGRGGDSTIFRAHQPALDRDVAIKVVSLTEPDDVRRFEREISLTVRLGRQHPNIVNVLDTRTLDDGRPAIVMDFHELGSTYDRLRATGPYDAEEVARIGRVVGEAIGFAHTHGVLHRDVKPQNILVLPTSYVLADFGIARPADAGHTGSLERLSYRHSSPEVLDGHPPEPADDVWSLVSSLFMLLEGRAPFAADDPADDTALAYLRRVRLGQRRPVPDGTPTRLREILDRGLDPLRDKRYATADDLVEDLRSLEHRRSVWAPGGTPGGPAAPSTGRHAVPEVADDDLAWAPGARAAVDGSLGVAPSVLRSERPAEDAPVVAPAPAVRPAAEEEPPTADRPDAVETGLRPEPVASRNADSTEDSEPAAPARPTRRRIHPGVWAAAVAMLVASGVGAYFIAKPTDDTRVTGSGGLPTVPRTTTQAPSSPSVAGGDLTNNDPEYAPVLLTVALDGDVVTATFQAPQKEATVALVDVTADPTGAKGATQLGTAPPGILSVSGTVSLQTTRVCVVLVGFSPDGSATGASERRCVDRG